MAYRDMNGSTGTPSITINSDLGRRASSQREDIVRRLTQDGFFLLNAIVIF